MTEVTLSISDLKLILQEIFIKTGDDFRRYSISSMKNKIETLMSKYNYIKPSDFIEKIRSDKYFTGELLFNLYVSATEMLRDPSLWEVLQKNILPRFKKKSVVQIAVPHCTTGEELYTLMFFLNKSKLLDKTTVYVYANSLVNLKYIKEAKYSVKIKNQIEKNIEIINAELEICELIYEDETYITPANKFHENIEFYHENLFSGRDTRTFDLILFRNQLIYFNDTLHNEVIAQSYEKLNKNGYLILGIKENVGKLYQKKFKLVSKTEKIYKKTAF